MFSRVPKVRKWQAIFAFIAVVILILIVVLVWGVLLNPGITSASTSAGNSAAPDAVSPSASASAVGRGDHVCDVPVPADQQFSGVVPTDYKFKTSGLGIIYPVSALMGPTYTPNVVGYCFAHNPTGAAMAAVQAVSVAGDPRAPVAELKDLLTVSAMKDFDESTAEPVKDVRIVGYEIEQYSPERAKIAVVILLTRDGENKPILVKVSAPMAWENGDWKVDADPGRLKPVLATRVPDQLFKKSGGKG